ncbi:MAG TPA: prolyl oligopeptidase family serine peptidase, partial [Acidimicrobiales bacterium]|nr:prolyl oligopeptidase family serine peptidase [Acidimicrobiales bacterium]
MTTTRPYGSWTSVITSQLLVEQAVRLGDVRVAGGEVWWNEGRPAEDGRQVLVSATAGGPPTDRLPPGFSCRTAVHEYGGDAYVLVEGKGGSSAVFANWSDQALWLLPAGGGAPTRLTAEPAVDRGDRFADFAVVPGAEWLLAVRERHHPDGRVDNDVVAVGLPSGRVRSLASGHDFYAFPRPSPDGRRVAWVSWDHPSMPWDSTELWVADLSEDGEPGPARLVAGGPGESVTQPAWSPDGRLHYLSDRSGWWNLYAEDGAAVVAMPAELTGPDWQLGQSTYVWLGDGRLVVTWTAPEGERIGPVVDGTPQPIDVALTSFGALRADGDGVVCVAGSPTSAPAVVRIGVDDGDVKVLRSSRPVTVDPAWISVPQAIEFPTVGDRTAHALWYPPTNPEFEAPAGERPPLMVISHGGPTSATSAVLNYSIQYWTSRGFGVVDVDYGGSTGYGREYRRRLNGAWGIVDVDDCVAAANWLADQGLVDRDRMVIRGGSAGGYTTLAALTFRDAFAAGASHYGVADLELLARDTHKFEAR